MTVAASLAFEDGEYGFIKPTAACEITDELGKRSIKISEAVLETKFLPYHAHYSGAATVAAFPPLGDLTSEDLGRRFTLKLELTETVTDIDLTSPRLIYK